MLPPSHAFTAMAVYNSLFRGEIAPLYAAEGTCPLREAAMELRVAPAKGP